MNYQKKIIEFSEGLLSNEDEQSLLSEIIVNDELRNQFKSALTFEKNIRNTAGGIKPDKKMRAGVFAAAGFADMSSSAVAAASGAAKGSFFLSKFVPIMATAVLSSILTGFAFVSYFNNSDNLQNELIADNSISENLPEIPKPHFDIEYEETQRTPIISQNKEYDYANNKASENTENKKLFGIVTESLTFINRTELIDKNIKTNQLIMDKNINSEGKYENLKITKFGERLYDILGNVSIEFSGMDNLFFDEQNVFSANLKPFINKNIGINYNINDYFFAGFSFRSENYYLNYTDIDEENDKSIYEQQPILYSYNLYAGAEVEIYRSLSTFIKLTGGATKIGPVTRADAGLGLALTNNIQLFGGVGYDVIFYNHQGREFNSNKWNINYGIKYNF